MKKLLTAFVIIAMIFCLFGCEKAPEEPAVPEVTTAETIPTEITTADEPKASPASFEDVMLGKAEFLFRTEDGTLEAANMKNFNFMNTDGGYTEIDRFAVLNLDGIGEDEVVLQIIAAAGDLGGFMVLHKENGVVYGFRFNNRTFCDLKTDGTFFYSAAAGTEDGIASVRFEENDCRMVKLISAKGEKLEFDDFTVNGQAVSEEEYNAAIDEQDKKPEAEWVKFSNEAVEKMEKPKIPVDVNFTYNPPDEIKNVHFISDDIIREIKFEYYRNSSSTADFLPEFIVSDMNEAAAQKAPEILTWLGVDRFDLNSDGVDDYIVEGQMMNPNDKSERAGDLPYLSVRRVYVCDGNGFKAFGMVSSNPRLCAPEYILSDKTNGMNDFLVPISGYSLVSFDGKSYTERGEISTAYKWEYVGNGVVKITCNCDSSGYIAMKIMRDESDVSEKVLYSSAPDGTPVIHRAGEAEFYAHLKPDAPEKPEDFWLGPVEMKFVPVEEEKAVTRQNFQYQLPECCKNLEWKCDLPGILIDNWDFKTTDFNENILPKKIVDYIVENGGDWLYYAKYYRYDMNDDGLMDWIIRAGGENTSSWYPFTGIFICEGDESYKFINCALNSKYIKFLETKTNGMYDILTGYYCNDIIIYDGKESYSKPFEQSFGGRIPDDYNGNVIRLGIRFALNTSLFPAEECYVIFRTTPEIDKYTKEKIWYACEPDGTPLVLNRKSDNDFDFYMELADGVTEMDFEWFVEMKFVPVEKEKVVTKQKFQYQLPECCKNLEWKCDLNGTFLEPVWDFTHEDFDGAQVVSQDIIDVIQAKRDDDSNPFIYSYYYKYDMNDDGLQDLLILAGTKYSRAPFPFAGLFIQNADGTYKYIDCWFDSKYIKILESKTNGMHDVLTGYYGDDIMTFDGTDSYSRQSATDNFGVVSAGSYYGNVYSPSLGFSIDTGRFPAEKCYMIFRGTAEAEKTTKEKIWYACEPDGTPIVLNKNDSLTFLDVDFYMELADGAEKCDLDWFVEMKFVPVE